MLDKVLSLILTCEMKLPTSSQRADALPVLAEALTMASNCEQARGDKRVVSCQWSARLPSSLARPHLRLFDAGNEFGVAEGTVIGEIPKGLK